MRNFLLLLLPLTFLQAHRPAMLHHVKKIVCIGDSITQMNDPGMGYVAILRDRLAKLYPRHPIAVVNAGIGGQKAPDMLARFQRDVIDQKPELVTLSVGINDVWHGFYDNHPLGNGPAGIPLPIYIKDITEMVHMAKRAHLKMLLVSPTVITEDPQRIENRHLLEYIHAEKEIAHREGVKFVDLHAPFIRQIASMRSGPRDTALHVTVDGVHTNDVGGKLMATEILEALGVPASELTSLTGR